MYSQLVLKDVFDPFQHAKRLGLAVTFREIDGANALWVPDISHIFLRPNMSHNFEKYVLTHEIGHAVLGHRTSNLANENSADAWAARRLVDPIQFDSLAVTGVPPAALAIALDVTAPVIDIYLRILEAA